MNHNISTISCVEKKTRNRKVLKAFDSCWPFNHSNNQLVDLIEKGLPSHYYNSLKRCLDLNDNQMSELLKVPIRTLLRRKKRGYFNFDESERIVRISKLCSYAIDVLGDDEKAIRWLKLPNRALERKEPLWHAKTELGVSLVKNILEKIEYGVFS